MRRAIGSVAAVLGGAAVGLGAFGAHALQGRLDEAALRIWHTAVDYQFWHALALLAVAAFAPPRASRLWRATGAAFTAGTVIFCASLYALALGAARWIGFMTPFGGACLILGWLLLALGLWRGASKP